MRRCFARKDLRLLFGGQTLSMFGDWVMIIVLGIWAKVLTGSNSAGRSRLLRPRAREPRRAVRRPRRRPAAQTTADDRDARRARRRDVLLLFVHDRGDMWLLYTVTALYGLGGDIFAAARTAMLKAMVPDELLGEANGAYQSIREGLRIVAPLAGAGIFAAFGGRRRARRRCDVPRLGCDARRAALRGAAAARRRSTTSCARSRRASRTSRARRVLRQLTIGVAAALLVAGFAETLIFAMTSDARTGRPRSSACMGTFQGVGAIVGGIIAARLMRRVGDAPRSPASASLLFGVGDASGWSRGSPSSLAATAIAGVGHRLGDRRARDRVPAA